MDTKESNEITKEIPEKTSLGKLKKDGTPRKQLTDEQKAKRAEILAKGRAVAHQKRRELEAMKKENPIDVKEIPPVVEPNCCKTEDVASPEKPKLKKEQNDVVSDHEDDVKIIKMAKKKKKNNKKKIIIVDQSDSSSSDDEHVIVTKKKKKPTPPPRPPPPPPPTPAVIEPPKTVQISEDVEKLRKEKIKRYQEKQRRDKLMSSIFG